MKKIVLLLIISLAFSSITFAQKQLTLNQVLLVSLSNQGDTVPQGKTWKVESSVSQLEVGNGETFFFVNDNKCNITKSYYNTGTLPVGAYGYASTLVNPVFPMWLPEGTIVKLGNGVSDLSILEFNIE